MSKILIIDDEILYDESFLNLLNLKYNFEILLATSSSEGLLLLKENPDIDAIILDIMIPLEKSSFTENEILRSENGISSGLVLIPRIEKIHPNIPILVLTARKDVNIECLKSIRKDNIEIKKKPITTKEVSETLKKLLYENK